jgi:hypothetical protein
VRLVAAHAAAPALLALVGKHQPHAGRLANDASHRGDAARLDVRDQPTHADAADFLVVRQREMDRPRKPAAQELGHEREPGRAEALHVGDAATENAVAAHRRAKRVAVPRLAVDRNNVGMAGQDNATGRGVAVARGQRRPQVRLGALVVVRIGRRDAVTGEVVAHPVEQRQVRVAAHRRERDQFLDQRPAGERGDVARRRRIGLAHGSGIADVHRRRGSSGKSQG